MTDYNPGDRVRVTYETTVDADGHYFGAGLTRELENQTVDIIERHNPRTTEPVGTVVKLTVPDFRDRTPYVVKVGDNEWVHIDGEPVATSTDAGMRDAEYVGHVSQIEWPDGYVFVGTTDKPIEWSESTTEDTDVSSNSVKQYYRLNGDTQPQFFVTGPGSQMAVHGQDLVVCDSDGWAYRRDTWHYVLAWRGDEHFYWLSSFGGWVKDSDPEGSPSTPITPAELTQAQRDGEKK